MSESSPVGNAPQRRLSLFDTSCIIVGIIIGAGIYETSPIIAGCLNTPLELMLMWVFGGGIALVGALCYAELATTYSQHDGGDYVYLTKAFGQRVGFIFAWAEYWIIRPGNVGMMAFVFARFAHDIAPLAAGEGTAAEFVLYASTAILGLTVLNLLGVEVGKLAQNVLTSVKVAGLFLIFVVGIVLVPAAPPTVAVTASTPPESNYQLALILVLFTYGGWNELSYVAAEVRDPKRNIFRALVLGTLTITFIYTIVNLSFVRALGMQGTAESTAVAADLLRLRFGTYAGRMISVLVCLSSLGAINGLLFTGSRVFYAAGADHKLIAWAGKWNSRLDAPLHAFVLQLAVTLALVIGFGSYEQGFNRLLGFTAPVYWFFATMVGVSLFILRWKEPGVDRPHRVMLYPVTPLLFCASCLLLFYASFTYAWANRSLEAHWTLVILVAGIAVSPWSGWRPGESST